MSKYFSDLDDNLNDLDVVLLQTTCDRIDELLFAKVQNRLNISNDNVIHIRTKEDFDTVKSLQGILTPTEGRWLIYCDTTIFIETNNLIDLMLHSNTCIFFIKVNYYKTYKDIKTRLKTKNVFDYYVTYLNRPNLLYIYDSLVPKSNGLTTQVITYLSKNYSSDIEQIFQLFDALRSGKVIDKPNDVVKCVGIGGNNIESFIFSLLTPISGSTKGLKLVKKKRYTQAYSIYNALGPKRFYDFYISGIYFKEKADINKFLEYAKWIKSKAEKFDRNTINYVLFEILAEYKRCGVPKKDVIKAMATFNPLFLIKEIIRRKYTAKKDIEKCVIVAKKLGLKKMLGTDKFPIFEK